MVEPNHSSYATIGEAASKQVTEHEKSRSRTRLGVTTGQIAIGTPSYAFKSKINLERSAGGASSGPSPVGGGHTTLNILN